MPALPPSEPHRYLLGEPDPHMAYDRLTLDQRKVAVHRTLGRFTRESMDLETYLDGEYMVAELTAYVLAKRTDGRTRTYDFKSPSGRWQYFKLACFPGWALKRWPVKWDVTTVRTECEHLATFPEADIAYISNPLGCPVQMDLYRMDVEKP